MPSPIHCPCRSSSKVVGLVSDGETAQSTSQGHAAPQGHYLTFGLCYRPPACLQRWSFDERSTQAHARLALCVTRDLRKRARIHALKPAVREPELRTDSCTVVGLHLYRNHAGPKGSGPQCPEERECVASGSSPCTTAAAYPANALKQHSKASYIVALELQRTILASEVLHASHLGPYRILENIVASTTALSPENTRYVPKYVLSITAP